MPFTIEAVDFFYLRMPEVLDIGDGSQDALLVRIQAGQWIGWGECEASPLVSIASWVAPMSHSACKPVRDSVLGKKLDEVADIARIHQLVRENGLDMLQTDHTLSGIDIALWDLLGHRFEEPVYRLMGIPKATRKTPYASVLFGNTPDETAIKATFIRNQGFRAAKFGWGPFGSGTVADDEEQLTAARDALGSDIKLMVDAGTVWGSDVEAATLRLSALERVEATWLEEPFIGWALGAHRNLAARTKVPLAGGEGCHHELQAINLMEFGSIGFIQIDSGRIGGITSARRVALEAATRGVTYVNHTFTSALAFSASLQPFADHVGGGICEMPIEPKPLAIAIGGRIVRDADGLVGIPAGVGLGVTPETDRLKEYSVPVEILINGRTGIK